MRRFVTVVFTGALGATLMQPLLAQKPAAPPGRAQFSGARAILTREEMKKIMPWIPAADGMKESEERYGDGSMNSAIGGDTVTASPDCAPLRRRLVIGSASGAALVPVLLLGACFVLSVGAGIANYCDVAQDRAAASADPRLQRPLVPTVDTDQDTQRSMSC